MKYTWLALPVAIGVGATLISAQEKQPVAAKDLVCAEVVPEAEAKRFFAELRAGLKARHDPVWFNRFAGPRLGVVRKGEYSQHDIKAGGIITLRLVSLADWREIARKGAQALEPVGRQGCLMDNGKAWFAVDRQGSLRLITINHDMAWRKRSGGS